MRLEPSNVGLLVAILLEAGELGFVNGAKVTGINGAGAIAGENVKGAVVSLCTGVSVDPSGALVAGDETMTGVAVVEPSGAAVVPGSVTVGTSTFIVTGTFVEGVIVPLCTGDCVEPSGAVVAGTVGTDGVKTDGAVVFRSRVGAMLGASLAPPVGFDDSVGSTEDDGGKEGGRDDVGAELDDGVSVISDPMETGGSVSNEAGGPVVIVEGVYDGASDSKAVQFPASKNGIQSNAQSVLLT